MCFRLNLDNNRHVNAFIDRQKVEHYKYLVMNINNRLDWHMHVFLFILKITKDFTFSGN